MQSQLLPVLAVIVYLVNSAVSFEQFICLLLYSNLICFAYFFGLLIPMSLARPITCVASFESQSVKSSDIFYHGIDLPQKGTK